MQWSANTTTELSHSVTHLDCSSTGEKLDPNAVDGLSKAGKPILVRDDLDGLDAAVTRDIESRPPDVLLSPRG